jgi:archaeoflavoprotein AfpA
LITEGKIGSNLIMQNKIKIAWGITGSGDKIRETFEMMSKLSQKYKEKYDVEIFVSKSGEQVLKYYNLIDLLKINFNKIWIEKDANTPFLAGRLQSGQFKLLLIAPATSNTVAKVAHGISDTLITNGIIQALKAYVPVFIMPSDLREGVTTTILPNKRMMKIRIRKEDANNVKTISTMDGITVIEKMEDITKIFD